MAGKDKIPKQPVKVKLVKLARLKLNQKRIDLAMKQVIARNTQAPTQPSVLGCDDHDDHDDPDLEAPVLTEGTEWIDVDDRDNSITQTAKSSAPAPASAASYAQMALPGHVKTVNPPRSETSANTKSAPGLFGSHALEHKAEVQPIFLAYTSLIWGWPYSLGTGCLSSCPCNGIGWHTRCCPTDEIWMVYLYDDTGWSQLAH